MSLRGIGKIRILFEAKSLKPIIRTESLSLKNQCFGTGRPSRIARIGVFLMWSVVCGPWSSMLLLWSVVRRPWSYNKDILVVALHEVLLSCIFLQGRGIGLKLA